MLSFLVLTSHQHLHTKQYFLGSAQSCSSFCNGFLSQSSKQRESVEMRFLMIGGKLIFIKLLEIKYLIWKYNINISLPLAFKIFKQIYFWNLSQILCSFDIIESEMEKFYNDCSDCWDCDMFSKINIWCLFVLSCLIPGSWSHSWLGNNFY